MVRPCRARYECGVVRSSVLAYPKFELSDADRHELLGDYLPWCTTVLVPDPPPAVPDCRDPCDTPFLQLAVAGDAEFLVSGYQYRLSLSNRFPCPITSTQHFLDILRSPSAS